MIKEIFMSTVRTVGRRVGNAALSRLTNALGASSIATQNRHLSGRHDPEVIAISNIQKAISKEEELITENRLKNLQVRNKTDSAALDDATRTIEALKKTLNKQQEALAEKQIATAKKNDISEQIQKLSAEIIEYRRLFVNAKRIQQQIIDRHKKSENPLAPLPKTFDELQATAERLAVKIREATKARNEISAKSNKTQKDVKAAQLSTAENIRALQANLRNQQPSSCFSPTSIKEIFAIVPVNDNGEIDTNKITSPVVNSTLSRLKLAITWSMYNNSVMPNDSYSKIFRELEQNSKELSRLETEKSQSNSVKKSDPSQFGKQAMGIHTAALLNSTLNAVQINAVWQQAQQDLATAQSNAADAIGDLYEALSDSNRLLISYDKLQEAFAPLPRTQNGDLDRNQISTETCCQLHQNVSALLCSIHPDNNPLQKHFDPDMLASKNAHSALNTLATIKDALYKAESKEHSRYEQHLAVSGMGVS